MPVLLIETTLYSALKENLGRNALGALQWVERAITEDPGLDHPGRLPLDNGEILDVSAEDLRVVYAILSDTLVELRRVFDERAI
jgi:hypothetical protein